MCVKDVGLPTAYFLCTAHNITLLYGRVSGYAARVLHLQ